MLEDNAHHEDEQHQHDRRSQNQQAESAQPVFEFGFWRAGPQPGRDIAEHRRRTRGEGHRRTRSADDGGAEEHEIGRVGARRPARGAGGRLVGWQRFACEHRLLNGEIARLDESRVGRDQIAGREPEHIARHDVPQRRLLPGAVSEHRGRRGHRRAKLIRRLLRPVRLPEVDRDTEHDHRHDDHGIDGLTERSGNRARDEQNDDERVREEVQQLDDGRQTPDGSRLVRAVLGQPPRRFGAAQALLSARHATSTAPH